MNSGSSDSDGRGALVRGPKSEKSKGEAVDDKKIGCGESGLIGALIRGPNESKGEGVEGRNIGIGEMASGL